MTLKCSVSFRFSAGLFREKCSAIKVVMCECQRRESIQKYNKLNYQLYWLHSIVETIQVMIIVNWCNFKFSVFLCSARYYIVRVAKKHSKHKKSNEVETEKEEIANKFEYTRNISNKVAFFSKMKNSLQAFFRCWVLCFV